jgi:hypothetical protein
MFFHSFNFSFESSKETSCTVQLLCQFQLTKSCQLESELEEARPEPSDFNLENWKPAQVPNTHLIRKKIIKSKYLVLNV